MRRAPWLALLLLLLVACGSPQTASTTTNAAPTQTRAAELAQLATMGAPTATSAATNTPSAPSATQTPKPPTIPPAQPTATAIPPTATAVPPTATPAPPAPTAGPAKTPNNGQAVFGTDYNETEAGFEIVEPQSIFAVGATVAYVALFKEAAQTTTVQWFVVSVSANGSESIVDNRQSNISDPSFDLIAGRLPTTGMKAGTYKLKYVRGTTYQAANLLAEGTFTLAAGAAAPAQTTSVAAPLPKVRERGESKAFAAFAHEVVDNAPPLKFSTGRCCLAEPKAGNRWVALDISIEDSGTGEVSINSLYAKIKTADNREYVAITSGSFEPNLALAKLQPGDVTRGWLFFEIPTGAAISTFTYAPSGEASGSRVTIDLKP